MAIVQEGGTFPVSFSILSGAWNVMLRAWFRIHPLPAPLDVEPRVPNHGMRATSLGACNRSRYTSPHAAVYRCAA